MSKYVDTLKQAKGELRERFWDGYRYGRSGPT